MRDPEWSVTTRPRADDGATSENLPTEPNLVTSTKQTGLLVTGDGAEVAAWCCTLRQSRIDERAARSEQLRIEAARKSRDAERSVTGVGRSMSIRIGESLARPNVYAVAAVVAAVVAAGVGSR